MNQNKNSHCVWAGICYVEITKKAAQNTLTLWLESKNKLDRKAMREQLRSFGWYIVKRRSGEYQLMERLTIENAPRKFLQLVLDEVKLCLENKLNEVNLGFIGGSISSEIVRVKNVPGDLNACVLMV